MKAKAKKERCAKEIEGILGLILEFALIECNVQCDHEFFDDSKSLLRENGWSFFKNSKK